jgi:hypothetical protein
MAGAAASAASASAKTRRPLLDRTRVKIAGIGGAVAAERGERPGACPYGLDVSAPLARAWMAGYVCTLVSREAQFLADPAVFPVEQIDARPRFWQPLELLFLEHAYRLSARGRRQLRGTLMARVLGRPAGAIRVRACWRDGLSQRVAPRCAA